MLSGRGFFIWQIPRCEAGDAQSIAGLARRAGFTHVLIKVADGSFPTNIDRLRNLDLAISLATLLKTAGVSVWLWQYVYGADPLSEARMAMSRIRQLEPDGFVIDAEAEFKQPGKEVAARTYLNELRAAYPQLPLALSSYRFPSLHPEFPWRVFLDQVNLVMPQVYWEQAHNPVIQLKRCIQEYQAMPIVREIVPTGPAYHTSWPSNAVSYHWEPNLADIQAFEAGCVELALAGWNYFCWDECSRDLPEVWNLLSQQPVQAEKPEKYYIPFVAK